MQVGVLGINYKSSELGLRELLAKACVRLFSSESPILARLSVVLLSTCNRTEVYFSGDDLATMHSQLLNLLREEVHLAFEHKLYSYFGAECFAHLCRVTAGLDSAIVAETEIQRQVKMAYSSAACDHPLRSEMHFLFQKCLKIGKQIRSTYLLPRGVATLEKLIYDLCESVLDRHFSVFFMGNSEINRKILLFLKAKGLTDIALCTRGLFSAQEMPTLQQIKLLDWKERRVWQQAQVVICGSNYSEYAISPEQVGVDCNCKMIFDLSMPRNVDPRLSRHPEMRLFNIEELGNMMAAKRSLHRQEIDAAEILLRKQMETHFSHFHHKRQIRYSSI